MRMSEDRAPYARTWNNISKKLLCLFQTVWKSFHGCVHQPFYRRGQIAFHEVSRLRHAKGLLPPHWQTVWYADYNKMNTLESFFIRKLYLLSSNFQKNTECMTTVNIIQASLSSGHSRFLPPATRLRGHKVAENAGSTRDKNNTIG